MHRQKNRFNRNALAALLAVASQVLVNPSIARAEEQITPEFSQSDTTDIPGVNENDQSTSNGMEELLPIDPNGVIESLEDADGADQEEEETEDIDLTVPMLPEFDLPIGTFAVNQNSLFTITRDMMGQTTSVPGIYGVCSSQDNTSGVLYPAYPAHIVLNVATGQYLLLNFSLPMSWDGAAQYSPWYTAITTIVGLEYPPANRPTVTKTAATATFTPTWTNTTTLTSLATSILILPQGAAAPSNYANLPSINVLPNTDTKLDLHVGLQNAGSTLNTPGVFRATDLTISGNLYNNNAIINSGTATTSVPLFAQMYRSVANGPTYFSGNCANYPAPPEPPDVGDPPPPPPPPPSPAITIVPGELPEINGDGPVAYPMTVTNTGDVLLGNLLVVTAAGEPLICLATVIQPGESTTCTGIYPVTANELKYRTQPRPENLIEGIWTDDAEAAYPVGAFLHLQITAQATPGQANLDGTFTAVSSAIQAATPMKILVHIPADLGGWLVLPMTGREPSQQSSSPAFYALGLLFLFAPASMAVGELSRIGR